MGIIVFGAPGSGKGTHTEILSAHYNLKKISLGDILREEVKADTALGREVKNYMDRGELVPDEIVARVIENNLNENNFILEGYPRNIKQAQMLEDILRKKNIKIDNFIYLNVTWETIFERLSKRRVCIKCGQNYHLKNMPPKKEGVCDKCSGELIIRDDDRKEVIKNRWNIFLKEGLQILNFYRKRTNFIEVDASRNSEEVFLDIKAKLKKTSFAQCSS